METKIVDKGNLITEVQKALNGDQQIIFCKKSEGLWEIRDGSGVCKLTWDDNMVCETMGHSDRLDAIRELRMAKVF